MEIPPDLLKRYGAGTCTPEERQLVEDWLNEDNGGAYEDFLPGTELEAERTRIMEAVDAHLAKRKKRFYFRRLSIAALWLVLATVGVYLYRTMLSTESQSLEYRVVEVPYGKKMSVLLPDSSTVHLNSGTILTYPEAFEEPERLVTLEGEGFFEVARQGGKRFVVEAGGTRTEVLGTKFNVNTFGAEGRTCLTVKQGKVRFTAAHSRDTLTLVANNRAIYQKGQLQLAEMTGFDDDNGWTAGRLSFNHSSIAEMVPILERWYNVRITVSDPKLNSYKMRGKYENPSLQRILEDLAYATNVQFKMEGRNVTIYP